ncbi:MBL fold metallo-hydrolase [Desulfobacter curvatus]|uniref:MBL fold metallo-hydrolase n=1 Tax=Desulfobacter curvatus TaxID=2290 RepID=UPI000380082C|nr:MBL fold metallo-hydrolase [Desulfobacter curvatus]
MEINFTWVSETVLAIKTDFLFKTRLLPTHVFVLKTDTGLILFDTGSPGNGDMILKSIKAAGLEPKTIKAICLSHWHSDHTGSLAEITERLCLDQNLDIFIGQADLPLLMDQRSLLLRFHPFLKLPVPHSPGRLPNSLSARFFPLNPTGCEILHHKYSIKAIATPGHTPGHTAYLHQKTGSLFSGCALSLLTPNLVGLVPIFHNRTEQIRSGEYLAGMNFRYLFPVHMFLRFDEIPLERRRPISGKKGLVSKLMGDHLFFHIS